MEVLNKFEPRFGEDVLKDEDGSQPGDMSASAIPQVDLEDPDVNSFIECIRKAKRDPRRVRKMASLQEDQMIFDYLFDDLPKQPEDKDFFEIEQEIPPMMKASLYDHVFSKYQIDGNKLPRLRPVKVGMKEVDIAIVDSLKDEVLEEFGFNDLYQNEIFQRFFYEGCPIIAIGSNEDEMTFDNPDLEEMFFDPAGTVLQSKNKNRKRCKWAVRAVEIDRKTLNEFLRQVKREDLIDKISPGSPIDTEEDSTSGNVEQDYSFEPLLTDPVTLFLGSDIGQKKPTYCVFAGGSGTIIKKKKGKKYPFYKQFKGKFEPILPYNMFHFDKKKYRKGLYSQSAIGIIKDGAEALKKNLNHLLPSGAKAVNGYLMLFGGDGARTIEDFITYSNLQLKGVTPIIESNDPNTSMQFVAPDISKIWDAYERMRKTILDDLGSRLRINFRIQEEVDQTATEFVGKVTDQNKQVASLNFNNKDIFEWVAEVSVDMEKKKGSIKNRVVHFGLDIGDEEMNLKLSGKSVFLILKGWDGTFFADTDIKVPLTQSERRQALDSTIGRLATLLQGLDYQSEEEVRPILRAVYKEIVMNELDDEISMSDLMKMANQIILRRQPLPQPAVPGGGSQDIETEEEAAERAVTEETSPLSFLAQNA